MSEKAREIRIQKIRHGIVIDHIRRGRAFEIARLLELEKVAQSRKGRVSIGVNFPSRDGLKDFIKVENFDLTPDQLAYVALISPEATINTIREFEVVRKERARIPAEIGDVVFCPDKFCITNHEPVPCRFHVIREDPLTLRCHYCETEFYDRLIRFKT